MIEFETDGVEIMIAVTERGGIQITATDLSYSAGAGAVTLTATRDQAVQMAAALILAAAEADQAARTEVSA
jgi:hypothetical protein